MNTKVKYSLLDRCCLEVDRGLRTLFAQTRHHDRERPDLKTSDQPMTAAEKQHVAGLMRVNHCGEICAQALYQGQAITARDPGVRATMQEASDEENDHLAWCEQRLADLHDKPSILNPVWYTGALALGLVAGVAGDAWSLGFLAETERQVVKHLESHLEKLPVQDEKSRTIVATMREDEARHATTAVQSGARELPAWIKKLMTLSSKVMTSIVYKV